MSELGESDGNVRARTRQGKPGLGRLVTWVALGLVTTLIATCLLLALVLDQSAFVANTYLQAVSGNNKGMAHRLGDHYTDDKEWRSTLYEQEIERDLIWLAGARITDVQTSHEETLSGQAVTVVRFNWRPSSSHGTPQPAALRVKTARWFLLTYITAVEIGNP